MIRRCTTLSLRSAARVAADHDEEAIVTWADPERIVVGAVVNLDVQVDAASDEHHRVIGSGDGLDFGDDVGAPGFGCIVVRAGCSDRRLGGRVGGDLTVGIVLRHEPDSEPEDEKQPEHEHPLHTRRSCTMHAGRITRMPFDSAQGQPYAAVLVGAGPAGSAAARLLASWNHRVALLHRSPVSTLAESIPPSCHKLFTACGLAEAIDAAGFYRSTGNTVWWGSVVPRCERFAHAALGYQVDRAIFDKVLRDQAVAAGAELSEALVRAVEVDQEGAGVQLADDTVVRARFVLDCSGRAGVVARRGWRTAVDAHPRTVALTSSWTSARGWPAVEPTHTLVESYADGWAWSVPLSPEARYLTVMIDPHRTDLARGRPASEVYAAEVRKTRRLAAIFGDGVQHGPWGFDASVYTAHVFASDPLLLVGDAGSFVDPLSSYGIKKALASAWLAAVAVHTSLRTPAMAGAALAFYAAREDAIASSLLRQSRLQFEGAESVHRHAFWADRATELDPPAVGEPDLRTLRDDPRVQRAFAWLKDQDTLALRPGATLRREPYPMVRGHEIVMEERLIADGCAAGLRYLRDVDLIGVLALSLDHDQVPALFGAYNRRFPPVSLPDFLGALSVMIAFGLLENSRASIG